MYSFMKVVCFPHPVTSPRCSEDAPVTQCDTTARLRVSIHSHSHSQGGWMGLSLHNTDPVALKPPRATSGPQHTSYFHSCFPLDWARPLETIWISHMHFVGFVYFKADMALFSYACWSVNIIEKTKLILGGIIWFEKYAKKLEAS